MKKLGWDNADLARELGASSAYIIKIVRGDQNLSIDKLSEIVNSSGADANFNLGEKRATSQWLELARVANKNK